jgi:hypothetical protein
VLRELNKVKVFLRVCIVCVWGAGGRKGGRQPEGQHASAARPWATIARA